MQTSNIAADLVDRIENDKLRLPSVPDIIIQINVLINDDTKGIADIAVAVQKHQTLSARLLQVVNSAALRPIRPVTTITEALSILGISLVRNLTISLAIRDIFRSSNPLLNAKLSQVWTDSIRIGALSFLLVKALDDRRYDAQTAMTIGVLHSLGALPIIDYFNDTKCDIALLDQALADHTQSISAYLLERWHLPTTFISAVNGEVGVYGDALKCAIAYMQGQEFPECSIHLTLEQFAEIVKEQDTKYQELVSVML